MEKNETLKLNEIPALGPSISVLMEGYQDSSVTSLRGNFSPSQNIKQPYFQNSCNRKYSNSKRSWRGLVWY